MKAPKVTIIILNWNGWKETLLQAKAFTKLLRKVLSKMLRRNASLIECLESLYQISYPNYDVIVVDIGSEAESVKRYLYKKMTNFNMVIK